MRTGFRAISPGGPGETVFRERLRFSYGFATFVRHAARTIPRLLRTILALVLFMGVLALVTPATASTGTMEKRLIHRINHVRVNHGLHRLRVGHRVQRGADSWARYLMRADAFYHGRLAVGTGEVIAWGTCSWFSPRAAVRAWLRSYEHRVLVLRPGFRRVGAGWARGSWRDYGCVKMAVARFR
jgi:uncharacterized protein YkwD